MQRMVRAAALSTVMAIAISMALLPALQMVWVHPGLGATGHKGKLAGMRVAEPERDLPVDSPGPRGGGGSSGIPDNVEEGGGSEPSSEDQEAENRGTASELIRMSAFLVTSLLEEGEWKYVEALDVFLQFTEVLSRVEHLAQERASLDTLANKLNGDWKPTIIHFACHGGLRDGEGKLRAAIELNGTYYTAKRFAEKIRWLGEEDGGHGVLLVYLSCCYGLKEDDDPYYDFGWVFAENLGVQCVLGPDGLVDDFTCHILAHYLYFNLLYAIEDEEVEDFADELEEALRAANMTARSECERILRELIDGNWLTEIVETILWEIFSGLAGAAIVALISELFGPEAVPGGAAAGFVFGLIAGAIATLMKEIYQERTLANIISENVEPTLASFRIRMRGG